MMINSESTYEAVRACSIALLSGVVLQSSGVSAGNGSVIDWRTVTSGETIQSGADAFETAQLFVALVGPEAALVVVTVMKSEPFSYPKPVVSQYAPQASAYGGRNRSFEVHGFHVMVRADEDDAAQERFTRWLAKKSMEFAPNAS